jgi:hypothetical protein
VLAGLAAARAGAGGVGLLGAPAGWVGATRLVASLGGPTVGDVDGRGWSAQPPIAIAATNSPRANRSIRENR